MTTNMVSVKLFAGTNIGLRENNEDNFTVCPDLLKNEWIVPADNQQAVQLGRRGCIMVVSDGMGGQNAGEVASAIAIATVQEMFSPNHLPSDVLDKPDTIKSFLKKVVSECDIRIKKRSEEDPSTLGMGATLVMSWLIGHKLYVAWIGDSRAYSFVNGKGIARLSKDHSYVQQLVDAGTITDEEAMNHPNSNVIMRSLGDTSQKAKADVVVYDAEDGQIILLCSDGLCGVCRDEEIGGIIEEEQQDLLTCKEKLTTAALAAGGSDNITVSLMQIKIDSSDSVMSEAATEKPNRANVTKIGASIVGVILLVALVYVGLSLLRHEPEITPSIKIWLDANTLAAKGETAYHIAIVGDSLSSLEYDENLIRINTNDSTITVGNRLFSGDKTTYIKVICKHNQSLVDSVRLVIKRAELPTGERSSTDDTTSVEDSENNAGDTTDKASVSDTLTPANGSTVDTITVVQQKKQQPN